MCSLHKQAFTELCIFQVFLTIKQLNIFQLQQIYSSSSLKKTQDDEDGNPRQCFMVYLQPGVTHKHFNQSKQFSMRQFRYLLEISLEGYRQSQQSWETRKLFLNIISALQSVNTTERQQQLISLLMSNTVKNSQQNFPEQSHKELLLSNQESNTIGFSDKQS